VSHIHGRRERDERGLFMLKFAVLGAMLGVLATTVGDVAAGVVLFGAAAATLAWGWRKIVTPLVNLSNLLEGLPSWMKARAEWEEKVDDWHVEDRMAALEGKADTAAERADVAAGQADEAAARARESVNVARAIARKVGASVRGDDGGEP
jgi:hypothetical protein